VALVVAPMSTRRPRRRSPDGPLRWATHRRLDREARTLQSRGTMVVRFEPGPETLHAMGLRMMANDRSDRVVEAAVRETRAQVAAEGLQGLLGAHRAGGRGPSARSMPA